MGAVTHAFRLLRRLLAFAGGRRYRLWLAVGLAALAAITGLAPAVAVGRAVAIAADPDAMAATGLAGPVLLLILAMPARWILMLAASGLSHAVAYDVIHGFRLAVVEALGRLPLARIGAEGSGALRKALHEDLDRIELVVGHQTVDAAGAVAAPLAAVALIAWIDPVMALAAVVTLPVAVWFQKAMWRGIDDVVLRYVMAAAAMNGAVVEHIRGMAVVKSVAGRGGSVGGTAAKVRAYGAAMTAMGAAITGRWTGFRVALGAGLAVMLPVALWRHAAGAITLPDMVLVLMAGIGIAQPLLALTTLASLLKLLEAGLAAPLALIDTPVAPGRRDLPAELEPRLRYQSVGLDRGGRAVLDDVCVEVPPGGFVALVGPSGAGKTSLAEMAARFTDPDRGRVTIGGVDLAGLEPEAVGQLVSILTQEVQLLNDSAAGNLRLARPEATPAEMAAAARAAGIHEVIMRLPEGYDTPLGERGQRLSGGERQRLALARALLREAPVLVLDEATAHADPETEAAILAALRRLRGRTTILVVAHRLATIADADRIVVLAGGRVADQGRHDELLARCPLYAEMWRTETAARGWRLRARDGMARDGMARDGAASDGTAGEGEGRP